MKRRHRIVFFMIAIFLTIGATPACSAKTQDVGDQLDIANRAYASGRLEEAISRYRKIIAASGFSAEILHNLGNSYAENNQYGLAILQYLRGLSIVPGDDDLQGSLELARKNSGLFQPEKSVVENLLGLYDMNQWALGALGGYISITLLLLLHALFPIKKALYTTCFLSFAFICVCLLGSYQQSSQWQGGVVVRPGERLLMSPFQSALSQGILDEGSLVFSEKKYGKYHYIRDEKGRSGWVRSTAFQQIKASHLIYSQDNAAQ